MQDKGATFARFLKVVAPAYFGGPFGRLIARHLATLPATLLPNERLGFERLRAPASSLPDRQRLRAAHSRPRRYALDRICRAIESDARWCHLKDILPASPPHRVFAAYGVATWRAAIRIGRSAQDHGLGFRSSANAGE